MIETNESLLERLREAPAHSAWREFYDGYWSPIVRYARRLGLDVHQAEEVLQETMVALMRALPRFAYDRRKGLFRNFLLTIVHRKALAALRRARRSSGVSLDAVAARGGRPIENEVAALTAAESVEAHARWREVLMAEALASLRQAGVVEPLVLAVFEAYVVCGESAPTVAAAHGVKENAVYQIKNRLMRRLRIEVDRRLRETDTDTIREVRS